MTALEPPNGEPALLRRMIEKGGRVRPLSDSERKALLVQIGQRLEKRRLPRRRRGVVSLAAALSLLLALLLHSEKHSDVASQQVTSTSKPSAPESGPTTPKPPGNSAPAPPRVVDLGGRGTIELSRDALAQLPLEVSAGLARPLRIELQRGKLTASVARRARKEPLSIVTPQVVVTVVGTRFSVLVEADVSAVSVEHGRVRVERQGRTVLVDGGRSIRSDDARFSAPEPAKEQRTSAAPCSVGVPRDAAGRECLRRAARASGLLAENALVSLALHERDELGDSVAALAHLREYERRFPGGRLEQEVALAMVRTLVQGGNRDEACAYAEAYARRFPADPPTTLRLRAGCDEAYERPQRHSEKK